MADHNGNGRRFIASLAAGVFAGVWATTSLSRTGCVGGDFTWPWRAARALLQGQNPYEVIRPVGPFPFDAYFKYPLPAAIVALPYSPLRGEVAAGAFIATSVALLTWVLTRKVAADGLENRWPLLLSGCVFAAIWAIQWSPMLAAALLLSPWTVGLGVLKPNLGLAMFAAKPSWQAATTCTILLAASLVVLPSWPADWLVVLRNVEDHYRSPIAGGRGLLAAGPALLMVLLRWRRPEARLIAVLACVPQVPTFYDQVLVPVAVARTKVESLFLAAASMLGAVFVFSRTSTSYDLSATAVLVTVYAPAAALVVTRPNVSRDEVRQ